MFSQLLLVQVLSLVASTAPTALNALAPVIANNPTDVVLRADFPSGGSQTVVGVIQFYSIDGIAKIHVDVTGLPKNSGLFSYHIHEKPAGDDKTCNTGNIFNPYGADGNCENKPDDSYCAVGDLSGKNGLINTTCFELFYYDQYLSLDPASTSYIGGKSINIHLVDTNQILACGTIKLSREPEDLLLLNAETEAEEVRKFEELAGIVHSEPVFLSATALTEEELAAVSEEEEEEAEAVDVVVDEEDNMEYETEFDVDEEKLPDSQLKNLEDLIIEDLEELEKEFFVGNASNVTNLGNFSNVSGTDEDESKACSLSTSLIFAAIAAISLSFFA